MWRRLRSAWDRLREGSPEVKAAMVLTANAIQFFVDVTKGIFSLYGMHSFSIRMPFSIFVYFLGIKILCQTLPQ